MAIDHQHSDPLRNPAVDYERADLSARGIVLFLVGLLIVGVFIELVVWGMFRFLSHSEGIFAQGTQSPLAAAQPAGPATPQNRVMENTPAANADVFPKPRLQTNDVKDMDDLVAEEHNLLDPQQPFMDDTGTVHLPISLAMKLIEQRGLPVRPNAPPADLAAQNVAQPLTMAEPSQQLAPETKPENPAKEKEPR